MLAVFLQTLPFFALIFCGYLAAKTGFFSDAAIAGITRFVFYFALSAMLFRFAASLDIAAIYSHSFILAYLCGCALTYGLTTAVALYRKVGIEIAAIEAQSAIIGNTGFLGVPLLVLLLGQAAAGPILLVLAVDLIVFSSLFTIIVAANRDRSMSLAVMKPVALGLVKNPMIMSMVAGLAWSQLDFPLGGPFDIFLSTLGSAATPGALFAIGASLAAQSADRPLIAAWLSFIKLIIHPLVVSFFALVVFSLDPYTAWVMITAAALPTAGNIFILAQHYNIAPLRVSSTILISTSLSIITLSTVIALAITQMH